MGAEPGNAETVEHGYDPGGETTRADEDAPISDRPASVDVIARGDAQDADYPAAGPN